MTDLRGLLEEYVRAGKVKQLATLDADGAPYLNNLWFASSFRPDRLYFISRPGRLHCENVRDRGRVAVAVLAMELTGPAQAVRGVTFTGTALELPTTGIDAQIGVYTARWAETAKAIDPTRLASGEAHHRRYEVAVAFWIRYDEVNFRGDPRQPVPAW